MSDQPDSPPLELLRRMDALADEIAQYTASLRQQAAVLEAQAAALAARTDHIMDRLDQIAGHLAPADAAPPAGDDIFQAIQAYKDAFGEGPPVVGYGSRIAALAALLREAVVEGRPLTDAEARRRLGMGALPPGALT